MEKVIFTFIFVRASRFKQQDCLLPLTQAGLIMGSFPLYVFCLVYIDPHDLTSRLFQLFSIK